MLGFDAPARSQSRSPSPAARANSLARGSSAAGLLGYNGAAPAAASSGGLLGYTSVANEPAQKTSEILGFGGGSAPAARAAKATPASGLLGYGGGGGGSPPPPAARPPTQILGFGGESAPAVPKTPADLLGFSVKPISGSTGGQPVGFEVSELDQRTGAKLGGYSVRATPKPTSDSDTLGFTLTPFDSRAAPADILDFELNRDEVLGFSEPAKTAEPSGDLLGFTVEPVRRTT